MIDSGARHDCNVKQTRFEFSKQKSNFSCLKQSVVILSKH